VEEEEEEEEEEAEEEKEGAEGTGVGEAEGAEEGTVVFTEGVFLNKADTLVNIA
jgi:hypothetical protein